jgi:hypothetical protein
MLTLTDRRVKNGRGAFLRMCIVNAPGAAALFQRSGGCGVVTVVVTESLTNRECDR